MPKFLKKIPIIFLVSPSSQSDIQSDEILDYNENYSPEKLRAIVNLLSSYLDSELEEGIEKKSIYYPRIGGEKRSSIYYPRIGYEKRSFHMPRVGRRNWHMPRIGK